MITSTRCDQVATLLEYAGGRGSACAAESTSGAS